MIKEDIKGKGVDVIDLHYESTDMENNHLAYGESESTLIEDCKESMVLRRF